MKKFIIFLASIIIILSFSSCSRYTNVGSGGCGAWAPKKFGNDRAHFKRMNWVNNPRSGRYRSGY
jgi:hypothetical protein